MEDFSEAAEEANNFKKFAKSEAEKRGGKERYRLYGHKFSDVKDLVKAKFLKKKTLFGFRARES
jgi:hypothetical protein